MVRANFLFDSVPAGRTEILVSKPGYLHADQPLNPDRFHELNNSPYTMTVRHDRTGLVLRLLPEAVIAGTIRGEDGEPLDRAVVYVEAADPHTNPRELRTVRPGVVSKNDGSFRLGGLAPGRYYVRVVTPALPANIDASGNGAFVEKRYPQEVYFPSTDASGAAGIDLAGGQQRKVDFSLVRSATPVPASDDASPEEPETSKLEGGPFQVSGVVVDTVHGQPIRHAYVALSLGTKPGGALETGDDGRFFFSDLPAGKYTLVAEARHYPLKYLNGHGGFYSALAVGPGLNTGSVVVRLSPECSFSGRVVDEAQEPVSNASVTLYRTGTLSGGTLFGGTQSYRAVTTDEMGIYSFRNLEPGKYTVAVAGRVWYAQRPEIHEASGPFYVAEAYLDDAYLRDGMSRSPGTYPEDQGSTLDMAFPVAFYPGTADPAAAAPILVAGGNQRVTDIVLQAVPALHIRVKMGTELISTGPTFGFGALVTTTSLDGLPFGVPAETRIVPSGDIDVTGIVPGYYAVNVTSGAAVVKSGELNARSSGRQTLDHEVSAVPMRTNVRLEGDPPRDFQEYLQIYNSQLRRYYGVQVSDRGELFSSGGGEVVSGEIVFNGLVLPGSYTLSPNGYSPEIIKSVSATGAVINGQEITIEGNAPVDLRVTFGAGGVVKGVAMRDGKPAQGALVLLMPPDFVYNQRRVHIEESNSDGTFALVGVIPGKYTLLAIQNGWDLEWLNPAVLAPYLSAGQVINVELNGEYDERVNVQ